MAQQMAAFDMTRDVSSSQLLASPLLPCIVFGVISEAVFVLSYEIPPIAIELVQTQHLA